MLRSLRSRRRPRYGVHVCAVISALLLLLSVSLLHTRLSSSHHQGRYHHHRYYPLHSRNGSDSADIIHQNTLLSDSDDNSNDDVVDKIDEHDTFEDQNDTTGFRIDDEELSGGDLENGQTQIKRKISTSGYYMDHITGSIRRAPNKRSIDDWDDYNSFSVGFNVEDQSKAAFGSDDIPIDEEVRRKVIEVRGIEDALLLKVGKRSSPLREGWGDWFDKKSDFLRRDRMFKSNLEVLNPMNNPILQDPDGVGVTGLTRGDKAVQKLLFNEFKKTPFLVKKPLRVLRINPEDKVEENGGVIGIRKPGDNGGDKGGESDFKNGGGIKIAERRMFFDNVSTGSRNERVNDVVENLISGGNMNLLNDDKRSTVIQGSSSNNRSSAENIKEPNGNRNSTTNDNSSDEKLRQMENREPKSHRKSEESSYIFADGKRWGYFPGLLPHLSFSDFMDSFFSIGKCDMRVFMVWNSPPWMYTVRHQRGLESLLLHHREACVVVLSETIELDFFAGSFVKDGYKVAVAMPNLDELLKDTPTHVFADVWHEWKGTKFYPTHYSELVRLAALYNLFIMECLKEFYTTYDDTQLRWNGADLLTRVARRFLNRKDKSSTQLELTVQPSYIFFPIGSQDIASYFARPKAETEKGTQDASFNKILRESLTFHFWSSSTSALIPEPGSLVAQLLDHTCIRCFDVL
ncbi:uncharacterized protein At4g19900 isoform X2 [Manihot esculenta]|uniref:uncharacterized protein At4g19900 isoform X2 n=1 Tax=Manihot esculenta TaxID=3983 RepID=UPI001CC4B5A9|nr:uncharacterized protein At4g19900 isoform X2 [Manihot esculenta]